MYLTTSASYFEPFFLVAKRFTRNLSREMNSKNTGNFGENVACSYLIKQGFKVIMRNYRKTWGEIDIICLKDNMVHFFEVKSITAPPDLAHMHTPEENVHSYKTRKIGRMIQTFFAETRRNLETPFNFHVLCVYLDMQNRRGRVKWLKNLVI